MPFHSCVPKSSVRVAKYIFLSIHFLASSKNFKVHSKLVNGEQFEEYDCNKFSKIEINP